MENYGCAAVRHWLDAEILKNNGRLDNAGHLVGFSAECAIKHRISSLQPSANSPHGHLPEILMAARKHLGARSQYNSSMFDVVKGDIFKGWRVDRRYQETGSTSIEELESWFLVTKRLLATANLRK